jgi:hypothetical protein
MGFAVLTSCCVFLLLASGGLLLFYRAAMLERISSVIAPRKKERSLASTLQHTGTSLGVVVEKFERVVPKSQAEVSVVQQRLIRAGFRNDAAVKFFYGTKVLVPLILCGIGLVSGSASKGPFMVYAGAIGMGYLVPDFWLGKKISSRQKKIRLGLPDVLDLLVICVEASVPYIVLSYAYWHGHFNSDPATVGRTVQINKHPYVIAGVAPPDFRGTELFFAPDLWAPLVDLQQMGGWDPVGEPGSHCTWVMGHLKPGVTPSAATADLNTIAASLAKAYPKEDDGLKFQLSRPGLVGDTLGKPARAFMAGLMAMAGLILLAACANLGSLFAARAVDRSREIAVRMALGSRRQLIQCQLFTEALLVSVAGGVAGMAGAVVILRVLTAPDFEVAAHRLID